MGERVLRGSRLGSVSYESDRDTELAPRQSSRYTCPKGHDFTVPFAAEADVPLTWECKVCGATANLVDGELPEPKKVKPARTHWDMLMERRTVDDLEEVLAERLAVLREKRPKKAAGPGRSSGRHFDSRPRSQPPRRAWPGCRCPVPCRHPPGRDTSRRVAVP